MQNLKTSPQYRKSYKLISSFAALFLTLILPITASTQANEVSSIFTPAPGEIRLEGVSLAKSLTIDFDGKKESLKRVAAGIRKKQIAILWPKVYVGQVFFNDSAEFNKGSVSAAFDSAEKASIAAISMTFLRDVSNEKILSGFTESLEKNGFTAERDPVAKELLTMVKNGGDIKEGRTIWIGLKKNGDANQTLLFVNGEGFLQKALVGIGASRRIFSMWFGRPADSGIEEFQKQLLGTDKPTGTEKRHW